MATATVSASTKSAQDQSTPKHGASALVEIIEQLDFIAPEIPLSPSQVSKLYSAAKNYTQLARAVGDSTADAEYFAERLAILQACVAASKSGKFSLPPEEMKRIAGIVAVKMLREISEWAEMAIEEGREDLKAALKIAV